MYTLDTSRWHIIRIVFIVAGMLVLGSLALAVYTGALAWLLIAGLVGFMQIVFALTGICPLALLLDANGVSRS